MKRAVGGTVALAGVVVGGAVVSRRRRRARWSWNGHEPAARWHVVTVNRPLEAVMPEVPRLDPIARLGEEVETQIRLAPGDRGTEIAARLRGGEPSGVRGTAARVTGQDPRQELRAALREAKQLLETGEVLVPDTPPTTRRTPTGLPVELAARRARGEGRL